MIVSHHDKAEVKTQLPVYSICVALRLTQAIDKWYLNGQSSFMMAGATTYRVSGTTVRSEESLLPAQKKRLSIYGFTLSLAFL